MLTVEAPESMKAVADRVRGLDRDRTVAEVAERLIAIEREKGGYRDPTPRRRRRGMRRRPDGVACFNYLYLCVTENVRDARASFEDPEFVDRLAVVFAEFYIVAYESATAHQWVSNAWAPLIERRNDKGIKPIQFAIAGMNAHINYDLAVGLGSVCGEFGVEIERGTPHHADFEHVNQLLEEVEEEVKHWFAIGFVGELDHAFGRADDILAIWSLVKARDQAWTTAQILAALGEGFLRDQFLLGHGRYVGAYGRGLLLPIGELLD
jgi:hypothetical protein